MRLPVGRCGWPAVLTAVLALWGAPAAGAAPRTAGPAGEAAASDTSAKEGRKPKDPITLRGCLHGTTLGDVAAEQAIPDVTPSVALRGSREIRRQLKDLDRHEVEVTGVLTPAPRSPLSGKWGGTRVTIGGADPRRPPGQQAPPPVASMEVTSIRSLAASCP